MIKQTIITFCFLCALMLPLSSIAETEKPAPWHKRIFSKSPQKNSPKSDLWAHIQGNLDIETHPTNPYVKNQYKWYSQNTAYLSRTLERSQPYLYHIVTELEARNLPLALALIPIVESDFNPKALSPVGAAGLWQLMPATARHLGVERNSYYDGRRDLMDSTRAAIDHLSYLNRFFKGDWLLVLAAYNAGEGTVQKAMKANQRAGKKTDFWSLTTLPRETRLYVPKILALAQVITDPNKINLELPFIPHAPMYDWVEIQQPIDLKKAATMAELSWTDFQHINSGYNKGTLPKGTHRLYLPIENATNLKAELDNMALASADYTENYKKIDIPSLRYEQQQVTYKIKSGDSLSKIAQNNGVSIADLRQWNNLSSRGTLQPGQKLTLVKTVPNTAVASANTELLNKVTYRVRRGDSLNKIASQFKVSADDLKAWNELSKNHMLQPGESLIVYVDDSKTSA